MVTYDEVIVGSGLSALGTILGIPDNRRTLVLCGQHTGYFEYYNASSPTPCAYHGLGGLGESWHGVIPMAWRTAELPVEEVIFKKIFRHFYPNTDIDRCLHSKQLFVPWRPIRPARELSIIQQQRKSALRLVHESVSSLRRNEQDITVVTATGEYTAKRVWLAAGPLHTPRIISQSIGTDISRGTVSDHVVCYLGQVDSFAATKPTITKSGVLFPAFYGESTSTLYTLRPARFSFKTLDAGIEQRAAFGLPTGGVIRKLFRSMSPGLLSEAIYNRTGLFSQASCYSLYAQIHVPDAYEFTKSRYPLKPIRSAIDTAIVKATHMQPFNNVSHSKRKDIFLPGIHLHSSIDAKALSAHDIDTPKSAVQIVDASAISSIGPEHHSFRVLCNATRRATELCNNN